MIQNWTDSVDAITPEARAEAERIALLLADGDEVLAECGLLLASIEHGLADIRARLNVLEARRAVKESGAIATASVS